MRFGVSYTAMYNNPLKFVTATKVVASTGLVYARRLAGALTSALGTKPTIDSYANQLLSIAIFRLYFIVLLKAFKINKEFYSLNKDFYIKIIASLK